MLERDTMYDIRFLAETLCRGGCCVHKFRQPLLRNRNTPLPVAHSPVAALRGATTDTEISCGACPIACPFLEAHGPEFAKDPLVRINYELFHRGHQEVGSWGTSLRVREFEHSCR